MGLTVTPTAFGSSPAAWRNICKVRNILLGTRKGDIHRFDGRVVIKPTPQANGNYDAIATMRAIIARDLIRDRRKAKLSQRDLALAAKVPQSTVARIESGKFSPRPGTLKKLYSVMR
ncbi:MAG: helix-turn-helix domain-containing protein [Phycisphaerae bacterium]